MPTFFLWLLGISPDHWEMIKQQPGGRRASYQLFVALTASIAFGCAVFRFGVTFMGWNPWVALAFGAAIGSILCGFDLQMFFELRMTVESDQRKTVIQYAKMARFLVFFLSILGNAILSVDHASDSIASRQHQDARTLRTSFAEDPRYINRLARATDERRIAQEQMGELRRIEESLNAKQNTLKEIDLQLRNELDGAQAPDGKQFRRGDGPRAKGLRNTATTLKEQIDMLETGRKAIGESNSLIERIGSADAEIASIYQEIDREIAIHQQGSTELMEAYIALVKEHPISTLFPFAFVLLVLGLADIMLMSAYGTAARLSSNEQAIAVALERIWSAQITAKNAEMRKRWGERQREIDVRQAGPRSAANVGAAASANEPRGAARASQAQSEAQQAKADSEAA